jgi:polyisoprenyl-phosphate glycosyltransferase
MKKIDDKKISVVVPVYDNSASLNELSERLLKVFEQEQYDYEILFVDDGSKDLSGKVLKDLASKQEKIKVIFLSRNFGQHPAICAGFEKAKGEIIILMDADLQDNPEDIPQLVDKLRESAVDVVYTKKKTTKQKILTRTTSAIFHYIFSKIVKTNILLNIGTFRAFNKKFLDSLLQYKEVNILYGPLMMYMGYSSCYIELPYTSRKHGKSSYTFFKRLKLAVDSLISYTNIPHKISVLLGAILLVTGSIYAIAIVLQYMFNDTSLPGGTTLIILVLLIMSGSLMLTLGIIGSYLFRVYQEVLSRPRYLIKEKINIE